MKKFEYTVEVMHSLFGKIGVKLSKPLTGMLAVFVACLLGGSGGESCIARGSAAV